MEERRRGLADDQQIFFVLPTTPADERESTTTEKKRRREEKNISTRPPILSGEGKEEGGTGRRNSSLEKRSSLWADGAKRQRVRHGSCRVDGSPAIGELVPLALTHSSRLGKETRRTSSSLSGNAHCSWAEDEDRRLLIDTDRRHSVEMQWISFTRPVEEER